MVDGRFLIEFSIRVGLDRGETPLRYARRKVGCFFFSQKSDLFPSGVAKGMVQNRTPTWAVASSSLPPVTAIPFPNRYSSTDK